MGSRLRRAASLLAVVALALIATTAAVADNPHATYTCTKTKKNGETDVRVSVPEPAVSGLTNAGFVCVADVAPTEDEGEDEGDDEQETTDETEGEGEDEGDVPAPGEDPKQTSHTTPPVATPAPPAESRTLFCSTRGPVERGNGDQPGIALNLPESEGALLVEKGLVTPAIFYAGLGVSCDLLPGFVYAGHWVDHVGEAVPGVGVYPYYVPAG